MWKRAGYVLVAIVSLFLGALALLVIFDWLSGDTFINSVRKGWFGFIFARLVALFLVVLALRRLWRWSPLFGGLISGLGILFLGAFFAVKSYRRMEYMGSLVRSSPATTPHGRRNCITRIIFGGFPAQKYRIAMEIYAVLSRSIRKLPMAGSS